MFSNKIKDAAHDLPVGISGAVSPPPKRSARSAAPSIISADLTVTGTLASSGDVQIDGVVEGDIHSQGLVIGEKAEVRGEILAEDVIVRGKVVGRIRARKVLLSATSHVEGDILHEAFAVEAGAFFEGNCRHSDNPLGEPAKAEEPRRPSAQLMTPQPQSQSQSAPRTGLGGLAPVGSTG